MTERTSQFDKILHSSAKTTLPEQAWAVWTDLCTTDTPDHLAALRRTIDDLCATVLRDGLTGLGNAALFNVALSAAIETQAPGDMAGFICLHADRYQSINMMFGQDAGDEFLCLLASRLADATSSLLPICDRHKIVIARTGTDEFCIMLPRIASAEALGHYASDLCKLLSETMVISDQSFAVSLTAGYVMYPADCPDPQQIMSRLRTAAHHSRNQPGGIRRFTADLEDLKSAENALEHDLRDAIETDTLELYWQPVFEIEDATRQGFEALLRWNRPGHGPISPAHIVPAAEACGLNGALDAWVLKRACQEAASWPDQSLTIAVNVSASRVRQGDLAESVSQALALSGVDPGRLEIEITERILIEDENAVRSTLEGLRALGVKIVLDDFGTGFSSLNYLRTLPLDKLKLDRVLTRDITSDVASREMVRTIVHLGRALGLGVTAEGVETEEHFLALRDVGCHQAQGYFLGRPYPLNADLTKRES